MSTVLETGDALLCKLWCTDNEQASVNSFTYLVGTVTGGFTDQDVADGLQAALIASSFPAILYNGASFDGIQVYFRNRTPLPVPALSATGAVSGAGGATGMSRQTAGINTWLTNFAGPKFRGRTYWPFPPTSLDQIQGIPSTAYLVDLAIQTDALLAPSLTVGGRTAALTLQLAHRIPNELFYTFTPILFAHLRQKWATQRRRGSYGRPNVSPF